MADVVRNGKFRMVTFSYEMAVRTLFGGVCTGMKWQTWWEELWLGALSLVNGMAVRASSGMT